jgi:hypothetical protein
MKSEIGYLRKGGDGGHNILKIYFIGELKSENYI